MSSGIKNMDRVCPQCRKGNFLFWFWDSVFHAWLQSAYLGGCGSGERVSAATATTHFFSLLSKKRTRFAAATMGKEAAKRQSRTQRHDPLHVELAGPADQSAGRKVARQKFLERNDREDEVEVGSSLISVRSVIIENEHCFRSTLTPSCHARS